MKKFLISAILFFMIIGSALYITVKPVNCSDCNKGKKCSTSYDCGEIGVCYCQFDWLEEQETGGGIPDNGTCYFE
jgi:hypothetical protein